MQSIHTINQVVMSFRVRCVPYIVYTYPWDMYPKFVHRIHYACITVAIISLVPTFINRCEKQ